MAQICLCPKPVNLNLKQTIFSVQQSFMYYRGQTFVRFLFLAEAGFYSLISPIEQKATPAMAKIGNPYLRRWLSTVDLNILTSSEQILLDFVNIAHF